MREYLATFLPDEWRARRIVWRSYTLVWAQLAVGALRVPRSVIVEEDFIPLWARGFYWEAGIGASQLGLHGLSIEMAGRQVSDGEQTANELFFDTANESRLVILNPAPLYIGDTISVELSQTGAAITDVYLTFHGVAALREG